VELLKIIITPFTSDLFFFKKWRKKSLGKMILHKNFCAFFQTKNMSFHKNVVGVNHLSWILKSDHLHLTCFFDFFWREMACPKNKNAQEKAVHFFFRPTFLTRF